MPEPEPEYDLVIIGGGINGAGIARDAAQRGMRVMLLEQNDFGSATSSWSSRLIHGGLRYLEYVEVGLVFESLRERRILLNIAPHLVHQIRINIPIYARSKRGPLMIRLGMIAYDLLSMRKRLPRHRMLSREELLRHEPGLNADGLRGGAQYYDAQVTFAERLVLENIIAAAGAGAVVKNYCQVEEIGSFDGAMTRVHFRNLLDGDSGSVRGRLIINASGPWVDRVLRKTGFRTRRLMGGTKGSHIIVGRFHGAPQDAFYVEAELDGRPFFIIPWNGQYLIGTTDIRYSGNPGVVRASRREIRYLLDETNRVFPGAKLKRGDIHFAYAGVRPLPRRRKGPESAITRRHIIKRHRRRFKGIVSIIGGKLTTYRNLAEQTVDRAATVLRIAPPRCRSATTPLPGAVGIAEAEEQLRALDSLSQRGRDRILGIYGGRAAALCELAATRAGLSAALDSDRSVLAAEVAFAIREEFARTLIDLMHRRLMLGLWPDQGRSLAGAVADAAAAELGWNARRRQAELESLAEYNARLRPG